MGEWSDFQGGVKIGKINSNRQGICWDRASFTVFNPEASCPSQIFPICANGITIPSAAGTTM